MTFWVFVGDLGLGLATAAVLLYGYVALHILFALIRDGSQRRCERRWDARKEAMANAVDALLLAKRLREDREVADLDAAFELPCAPGSFFRRDAA